MTFENYETSRQKGQPVFLYMFEYDDGVLRQFAYTDHEQDIPAPATTDLTGVTFQAVPIAHDSPKASGSLDKATFSITMAHDTTLAQKFRNYPPGKVVNVTVWQMHIEDASQECLVVWIGRLTSCSFDGTEASIACEPISTSLRRPALRRNYQLGCPHMLYEGQCGASKSAGTLVNRAVISVAGNIVVLAAGWKASPHPQDAYLGGMVEWEDATGAIVQRKILRIESGSTFFLSGPATGLTAGMSTSVVVGCNHQRDHCNSVHNNIGNFGGQPYIPTKSPFGFTMNYY